MDAVFERLSFTLLPPSSHSPLQGAYIKGAERLRLP